MIIRVSTHRLEACSVAGPLKRALETDSSPKYNIKRPSRVCVVSSRPMLKPNAMQMIQVEVCGDELNASGQHGEDESEFRRHGELRGLRCSSEFGIERQIKGRDVQREEQECGLLPGSI